MGSVRDARAANMPKDPRKEAQQYIKEKRVDALFQELGTRMVFDRPSGNPNEYLLTLLETMQKNRSDNKRTQFFEKEDVRTLFEMFDPTGRGEISVAQYNQALLSCGIEQPTVSLPNPDAIKVDLVTFTACVEQEFANLSLS